MCVIGSKSALWATLCCSVSLAAECPLYKLGTPDADVVVPDNPAYAADLKKLDIKALEKDLTDGMTKSQSCWPADGGHYGGLLIRLAWHCAGTYRKHDKKGGCHGGRIRFEPERSWMDNANLDKARALLAPLKQKYGNALSWGDLITFAGTVAIRSMKGPTNPHCFGRIDEPNGDDSKIFGTTAEFNKTGCKVQGNCTEAEGLGAVTVGLIYVNPEGPLNATGNGQDPDPNASALEIREVFGRMGMNDSETASLIACGHAFGKCHDGTSGFSGPWTTTPAKWSTQFLMGTLNEEWEKTTSGTGLVQWRTKNRGSALASTMRLTSDMALVHDDIYKKLLTEWAANPAKLDEAFKHSWDKLMTSGSKQWSSAKKCERRLDDEDKTDGSMRIGGIGCVWILYTAAVLGRGN